MSSLLLDYLKTQHEEKLNERLNKIFQEIRKNSYPIELNLEMSSYQFSTGGKRLRMYLPILVANFFKKDPSEIYEIGIASELLHNGTLVHDDLQDGDETRRGSPSVWKKYSPAQAINCGNTLIELSHFTLLKLSTNPELKIKILELFSKKTLELIEGQALEFSLKEFKYPTLEQYIQIAKGKTSALFHFALIATLIFFEIDSKFINLFMNVIDELGVIFQASDDLLDIYGNKGRSFIGSDIAEGKFSILNACFYTIANAADKDHLHSILLKPRHLTTQEDIEAALKLYEKYKIKKLCEEFIESLKHKIQNSVLANPQACELFEDLKNFIQG
jgi:geranylgeranyl pyrophosphate synthase